MGNKQQTPRALLELAEENVNIMTRYFNDSCVPENTETDINLAMIKFFQELDPNDNNAETKAGNDDASLLPHVKAKNLLTTVLTSIVSALLGRPISQANNKDRRATEEEKKDIGVLLSQGTVEKKTDKKNVKQIAPGLITTLIKNMKLFDVEAKKSFGNYYANVSTWKRWLS